MGTLRRRVADTSTAGRVVALLLLVGGLLGMHGVADLTGHAQHGPGAHTAAAHAPSAPSGDGHDHDLPGSLHDVLAGCVLALVGVAALVVLRPTGPGRLAARAAGLRRERPLALDRPLPVPGPPLRLSLCVQRV